MKVFKDMSDEEFEDLGDKMYDDSDCVSAFIENKYMEFEEDMHSRGIEEDYWCDHETEFCEHYSDSFMKFAYNYYYGES